VVEAREEGKEEGKEEGGTEEAEPVPNSEAGAPSSSVPAPQNPDRVSPAQPTRAIDSSQGLPRGPRDSAAPPPRRPSPLAHPQQVLRPQLAKGGQSPRSALAHSSPTPSSYSSPRLLSRPAQRSLGLALPQEQEWDRDPPPLPSPSSLPSPSPIQAPAQVPPQAPPSPPSSSLNNSLESLPTLQPSQGFPERRRKRSVSVGEAPRIYGNPGSRSARQKLGTAVAVVIPIPANNPRRGRGRPTARGRAAPLVGRTNNNYAARGRGKLDPASSSDQGMGPSSAPPGPLPGMSPSLIRVASGMPPLGVASAPVASPTEPNPLGTIERGRSNARGSCGPNKMEGLTGQLEKLISENHEEPILDVEPGIGRGRGGRGGRGRGRGGLV
jgi:hypothetical protein